MLATPSPVGGQIPVLYGTPVVGGAVYSEDHHAIVFGDLDGNVYGLDTRTGAPLWVKAQLGTDNRGRIVALGLPAR